MTETTETIPPAQPGPTASPETRRLSRARDGRWLGGVCAGLGDYFGLNPLVYRAGFAALSLAGGTGILLYVAAWLVMPDEGVEDSIAAEAIKGHRDQPWLIVSIALVGLAFLIGIASVHVWPSPGNLWFAAFLVVGAIAWWQASGKHDRRATPVSGAVGGPHGSPAADHRPRRRSLGPAASALLIGGLGVLALVDVTTGWNIDWRIAFAVTAVVLAVIIAAGSTSGYSVGSVVLLGLVVLVALAASLVIRVPIFAGIGDRVAHPVAFASVGTRYEHGIGNMDLDLQDVRFPEGETHVNATLGIGDLVVRVPKDATVKIEARSRGTVELFGRHDNGAWVHDTTTDLGASTKRVLSLDLRVGIGDIEVRRG
jgi:phage shock protein PspC (stress-responsive transcriptional regulator)